MWSDKNLTIKNSHRTLTKFMACDKVTQDTLKVELWNMQTNIQNHDLILINLAAIQKGSNATITNTDYISVQVLESNCSFTDKIITTSTSMDIEMLSFENNTQFANSIETVGSLRG